MIIPDANLLLYAYDSSSPFHRPALSWWEGCLSGNESVALCPMVLFAFVRIGTHPRAFENPMSIELAAGHVESWLNCRICRFVPMEAVDVRESLSLLTVAGVGADLTTDSQLAAIALRLDATIHSADTDFLRFPGIRVFNPLVKSG